MFLGMQVGTKFIDENDANVGESRTADRMISDAGFTVDDKGESIEELGEMVLVQSKTLTAKDPAFRAAIDDAQKTLNAFPKVRKLESPLSPNHSSLISKDGHSALITYAPKGTYEEAVLYIDTLAAAVEKVESRHAGVTVDSLGLSTDKALDAEIKGGLATAGMISIPLTIIVLMLVLGSLVAALIPLLDRPLGDRRHDGPARVRQPGGSGEREHHGSDPAGRPRGRGGLLASSTCAVSVKSGPPVAPRALPSKPPPPPLVALSWSRASPS